MVARLAAGIDRALLLVLEELNQFGNRGLLNAEAFLARMVCWLRIGLARGAGEWSQPGRLYHSRNEARDGFTLD